MLNPARSLYDLLSENYGKLIKLTESDPEILGRTNTAMLYIEYANSVLHYYKYAECYDYLRKA